MRGDDKGRLKVVMAGIKVFERSQKGAFAGGGECGYRLNQVRARVAGAMTLLSYDIHDMQRYGMYIHAYIYNSCEYLPDYHARVQISVLAIIIFVLYWACVVNQH